MININKLSKKDINRKVIYKAYEGATPETGRITSYNDKFIFVDYQNVGRGQATPPDKLTFENPN